jgi:hypothetical protein
MRLDQGASGSGEMCYCTLAYKRLKEGDTLCVPLRKLMLEPPNDDGEWSDEVYFVRVVIEHTPTRIALQRFGYVWRWYLEDGVHFQVVDPAAPSIKACIAAQLLTGGDAVAKPNIKFECRQISEGADDDSY